ncbi:MAG: hypothetical protein IPG67_03260 [Acidobacteria bacterium]|nr:hypothetical protein [Acidobacteriota bacterium]
MFFSPQVQIVVRTTILSTKNEENAVKVLSATVLRGQRQCFRGAATVKNGPSDNKKGLSDNPFLDESRLSLALPEPEFERNEFSLPSGENDQNDNID